MRVAGRLALICASASTVRGASKRLAGVLVVERVVALERGERARQRFDVDRRVRRGRVEHLLGGIDDRPVARAAAQVAGQRVADLLARRHRLVRASRSRSSHGRAFRRATTSTSTKPGVQKPHCEPWQSTIACCTGCSEPSGWRRSSTVKSALPSSVGRNWMHALTALNVDAARRVRLADHDRARAAVAFRAAFLGAGAARVFAQILQDGAGRRARRSLRGSRCGGRSGSAGSW